MESANTVQTDSSSTPNSLKGRTTVTVAFCGGGSGGHLTPAITLARAWVYQNPNIRFHFVFLCSGRHIDRTILNQAQLLNCDAKVVVQTATTSSQKLSLLNCLRKDFLASRRILKQHQPDIVLGTGGFASVAPVLAAKWLGLRPSLLELNAVPGKATRWLSRLCSCVWSGWPMNDQSEQLVKSTVVPFGVPIAQSEPKDRPVDYSDQQTSPILIVAGGSLGASRLNDLACDALADNRHLLRHWKIEHQTGPNWQPSSAQIKGCEGLDWNRYHFIPNLAQQFRAADVAISRAGAVTLAEIAHAQAPSILLPLSSSADNHQVENTRAFQDTRAAYVIDEAQSSASTALSDCLRKLVQDEAARQEMKQRCKTLHCHLALNNASEILYGLLPNTFN